MEFYQSIIQASKKLFHQTEGLLSIFKVNKPKHLLAIQLLSLILPYMEE